MIAIAIGEQGEGIVEFDQDDGAEVDRVLSGFGLDAAAPRRGDHGVSRNMRARITPSSPRVPADVEDLVKAEFRRRGYELGEM